MDFNLIPKKYRASDELRNKRLAICLSCEDLTGIWQCKHCFCFVHAKTKFKNEECAKPKPEEKKW